MTPEKPSARHVPQLDGVRGLAILLVLAFHSRSIYTDPSEIPYAVIRLMDLGWSGVDLFFVLSGFLITGILLDTRDSNSYFRTFYIRRVLRIFPLYFTYVVSILVVVRFLSRSYLGVDYWTGTNPWWYVTYLLNWKSDHGYNDLYLGHLWSLAIEEQFYFVWPLVVWLFPRKRLAWLCGALAVMALALRIVLYASGTWPEAIYRLTPTRMDTLALGALTAVAVRDFRRAYAACLFPVATVCGFLVLYLAANSRAFYWNDPAMGTIGASLLAVLYACLVFAAATGASGALSRLLQYRPLRAAGKYSYAMYVLQSMPYTLTVDWAREWLAGKPAALVIPLKALYFPFLTAIAFTAAWLSWRLLERRFLKLKERFVYA